MVMYINNGVMATRTERMLTRLGATPVKMIDAGAIDPESLSLEGESLIVGSGPGSTVDAGYSKLLLEGVVRMNQGTVRVPVLGIGLGALCLAEVLGATVTRPRVVMHGEQVKVFHERESILSAMPQPFLAGCYYSYIISRESLPSDMEILGWDLEGEVMVFAHHALPLFGILFEPGSDLTQEPLVILESFMQTASWG